MLVRGAFRRLAAEAPKVPVHDLPRFSHLLRARPFPSSRASQAGLGAALHAYNVTFLERRRAYATQSASQPTPKVKADVKKAAKKLENKAVPKKGAPAKRKTKAKKQPKAPSKKSKLGRPAKKLTPEERDARVIKDLKARALRPPPGLQTSAWQVFLIESMKGSSTKSPVATQELMTATSQKFKSLSPAEREHYNRLSTERREAKRAEYDAWVRQHTPDEIRIANNARRSLKRKGVPGQWARLVDDRVSTNLPPFIRFFVDRQLSGDFKDISLPERSKLIGQEWRALSADEKQTYVDAWQAAKDAA